MKPFVQVLLFLGLALCTAFPALARVWTIDGTNKVEAEFSGIIGDIVFLNKPDGSLQKAPLASLSAEDQAYIHASEDRTTSVVTSRPPPVAKVKEEQGYMPISGLLSGKLVVPSENGFVDYTPSNPSPDYYGIYFSAGWCGPCHRFTPQLAGFYRQMKQSHNNFEIVFVSRDNNEKDMLAYMREFSMPWPALRFSEIKSTSEITKYAGRGIPCLVIVDPQGKVLADSYVNGGYVGAVSPMNYLGKLLEPSRE